MFREIPVIEINWEICFRSNGTFSRFRFQSLGRKIGQNEARALIKLIAVEYVRSSKKTC